MSVRRPQGTAAPVPATPVLAVAVLAVAVLAAGCGTAAGPGSPPGRRAQHNSVAAARHPSPRKRATAYARAALRELRLPPGARRMKFPARLPADLRQPPLPANLHEVVDERALYRVGSPMSAVHGFVAGHVPAGWRAGAAGQSGLRGTVTGYFIAANPVKPPSWAYEVTLAASMVPSRGGGSLLRVDAQVAWYPPRSAAEHIDPGRYRAVTVVVPVPGTTKPRRITRTFTASPVVARLARLVNALPAMPDEVINCPAMFPGRYSRLVFVPRSGSVPRVVVTMPGCIAATVSVGGRKEPALDPGNSPLLAVMNRLLGVAAAG